MSLYYRGQTDSAMSHAICWLEKKGAKFEDKQLMLRQFGAGTRGQPPVIAEEWLRRLLRRSSPGASDEGE